MKDLVVGDLHGRKNNIDKVERVLILCTALARENNIDRTIFLGDIFDEKAYLRTEVANLYLKYFSQWPTKLELLVGNHDYSNSIECKIHALEIFKNIKGVTIRDVPSVESSTVFLPYKQNQEIIDWLNSNQEIYKNYPILYGHSGVDGCQYSSGSFEESSLKKEHFKGFKHVFMGHIHKPQSFNNITYVGTPFTKDYGEANEIKRVIIYDHKTDVIEDHILDISMHKVLQFEITSVRDLKNINKKLKEIGSKNIKLIISAPQSISKKVKASAFEVPIDSLKVEVQKEKVDRQTISETLSFEDMTKEYLKGMDTEFDVEELQKLSTEILQEVTQ